MPTIVVYMLLLFFIKNNTKKDYLEILPWTLFIGFVYTSIAFVTLRTLGYEFVTIVSSISTLIIATLSIKYHVLIPKNNWIKAKEQVEEIEHSDMSLLRAWSPYGVVILLLVLSRTVFPIKQFFQQFIDFCDYQRQIF